MKEFKKEIIQGNQLIGNFMQVTFHPTEAYMFKYHSSLDELMPVVDKIENITGVMTIHKNSCGLVGELPYEHGETTLEAMWKMSVNAIGWINDNNNKK